MEKFFDGQSMKSIFLAPGVLRNHYGWNDQTHSIQRGETSPPSFRLFRSSACPGALAGELP